jgi:hypothetical protein
MSSKQGRDLMLMRSCYSSSIKSCRQNNWLHRRSLDSRQAQLLTVLLAILLLAQPQVSQ